MEKLTTSFLHAGSIGDVWSSIPAMSEYYRKTGKKITLFLEKDTPAHYYVGATHPTRDTEGNMVALNQEMIDMMTPLLQEQECIADVKTWAGEPIVIDLNKIRETNVGMPNLCLSRWYFYVFPDLACDLSKPWLTVPEAERDLARGKIIISRTERYLNKAINYSFLKPYEKDILFVGTAKEYFSFKSQFGLDIERLTINNFLELAQAIKQCKFHISNQTQAFQLSQGLKQPRLLELCDFAPNVIVTGENAYDFFSQLSLEYYFDCLNQ